MRTLTETFKVYTFDTASDELKEKIKDKFNSCPDYGQWIMEERIGTLKAFGRYIAADIEYSLSLVPDRGEYIKMTPHYSFKTTYQLLKELLTLEKSCPLTGVCYDEDLRYYLGGKEINDTTIANCFTSYINSIHSEYESMLSNEYLADHCEANSYEFLENGELYCD